MQSCINCLERVQRKLGVSKPFLKPRNMCGWMMGSLAIQETTTATPTKTSLENISSRYLYYFAMIPIRSACTMWPNYPVTEQVGKAFKLRQRMKILRRVFTFSTKPLIWLLHVVVWSSTVKKCTKIYNAHAEPLFFSLNPIVLRRSRCRRRSSFLNSLIGSFSNDHGDVSENVTINDKFAFFKRHRDYSNLPL